MEISGFETMVNAEVTHVINGYFLLIASKIQQIKTGDYPDYIKLIE